MTVLRWMLVAGLLAGPDQALAQAFGEGASPISFWRVAGALALCLGLGAAAAFVLRRQMAPGTPWLAQPLAKRDQRLRLIQAVRLTPQVSACLLECEGVTVLVGAGPSGCTVLRVIEAAAGEGP